MSSGDSQSGGARAVTEVESGTARPCSLFRPSATAFWEPGVEALRLDTRPICVTGSGGGSFSLALEANEESFPHTTSGQGAGTNAASASGIKGVGVAFTSRVFSGLGLSVKVVGLPEKCRGCAHDFKVRADPELGAREEPGLPDHMTFEEVKGELVRRLKLRNPSSAFAGCLEKL